MSDHNFWTVDTTAYLKQMSQQDLRQEVYALHYQAAPRRNEESNSTTISLRFPVAVAVYYLDDQKANLQSMADALNACEGIANPAAIPDAIDALDAVLRELRRTIETGTQIMNELGRECDPAERQFNDNPIVRQAQNALAALQGGAA